MSYVTSPLRSRNFDSCSRNFVHCGCPVRALGGHPQNIRLEGRTLVLNALVGAALCVGVCLIVVWKSNKRLLSRLSTAESHAHARASTTSTTAAVAPHTPAAFLQLTR